MELLSQAPGEREAEERDEDGGAAQRLAAQVAAEVKNGPERGEGARGDGGRVGFRHRASGIGRGSQDPRRARSGA